MVLLRKGSVLLVSLWSFLSKESPGPDQFKFVDVTEGSPASDQFVKVVIAGVPPCTWSVRQV